MVNEIHSGLLDYRYSQSRGNPVDKTSVKALGAEWIPSDIPWSNWMAPVPKNSSGDPLSIGWHRWSRSSGYHGPAEKWPWWR